jgi:hypothetical protein
MGNWLIRTAALLMGKLSRRCLLLVWALASFAQSAWADYWVQVGMYRVRFYADNEARALMAAGFSVESQLVEDKKGRALIRLLVGPYRTRHEAAVALTRLSVLDHSGIIRRNGHAAKITATHTAVQSVTSSPLLGKESSAVAVQDETPTIAANNDPPTAVPSPSSDTDTDTDDDMLGLEDQSRGSSPKITGYFQDELAYAESSPQHLSKFRNILEVASQGRITPNMTWKVSGRVAYDSVFDLNNYYPTAVRDNQQLEMLPLENYMDVSAGDWDLRLGRQNIVWGETVGLFFADVVSAKDLREFLLPDFDYLRIPQWALRSEYFKGNFHGEAIWIPYPTYDNIGVPGGEFYPYPLPPPPGYGMAIAGEHRPDGSITDSNYGLRFSYLMGGWDLSGFYYNSMDTSATFFRQVVMLPTPTFVYTPDHTRIQQMGGTLSKGFEDMVLRAEAVYTHDRWFAVNQISNPEGVVRKDSLDYVVGLDYTLPSDSRVNVQLFQRWFPNHDPTMIAEQEESGASFFISTKLFDSKVEPQILAISSLNRGDWMASPKVVWTLNGNWRWALGMDFFGGSRMGMFGQYDGRDRIYSEVRYAF